MELIGSKSNFKAVFPFILIGIISSIQEYLIKYRDEFVGMGNYLLTLRGEMFHFLNVNIRE